MEPPDAFPEGRPVRHAHSVNFASGITILKARVINHIVLWVLDEAQIIEGGLYLGVGYEQVPAQPGPVVLNHDGNAIMINPKVAGGVPTLICVEDIPKVIWTPEIDARVVIEVLEGLHEFLGCEREVGESCCGGDGASIICWTPCTITGRLGRIGSMYGKVWDISNVILCKVTGHCTTGSMVGMSYAWAVAEVGADMVLVANKGLSEFSFYEWRVRLQDQGARAWLRDIKRRGEETSQEDHCYTLLQVLSDYCL